MSRRWSVVLLAATCALLSAPLDASESWIAVVVPASDSIEKLDETDIALIFRRKKIYAGDGARFQPVNLPADSALRRRFSRAVLKQSPEAMEDYWNEQYFQGLLPPHVLASETAVQRFVSTTAHGIGYVSACMLDGQLRAVLMIDGEGRVQPFGAVAPRCDVERGGQ